MKGRSVFFLDNGPKSARCDSSFKGCGKAHFVQKTERPKVLFAPPSGCSLRLYMAFFREILGLDITAFGRMLFQTRVCLFHGAVKWCCGVGAGLGPLHSELAFVPN